MRSKDHQAKVARSANDPNVDTGYRAGPSQPSYTASLPTPNPPKPYNISEPPRAPTFKPFVQEAAWVPPPDPSIPRSTADRVYPPPNGPPPSRSQYPPNPPGVPPASNSSSKYLPTPQVQQPDVRSPSNSR
ncbi:hypothetical protein FRB90_006415 [Tulasnella sp. 427]|nr:hypothetical protein FRB90_006415 [Tulasnella sp. 427]